MPLYFEQRAAYPDWFYRRFEASMMMDLLTADGHICSSVSELFAVSPVLL
jgi:hypothetical protein